MSKIADKIVYMILEMIVDIKVDIICQKKLVSWDIQLLKQDN